MTIYANGSRIAAALEEITEDLTLYHGVKLAQVMEAVYNQGIRDGRHQIVSATEELYESPELRHRNPGRPPLRVGRGSSPRRRT